MLPPNAKYLFHKNECYDWGTIGWVFSSGQVRGVGLMTLQGLMP